ncbi:type II secretion system F family protein [Chitinibacter tainanensis]|uniref:type II secretion system F family protein n=1 Tax=Chitinibacter tainanensis TaxID=230667 RepID=UPI0003FD9A1A|nr:type II secretion system F family protein [Chitinibacter tainanensis]
MQFRYRAAEAGGRIREGEMAATNVADLEIRLARLQLTLIEARAAPQRWWGARRIHRRELIQFCFHLEQLTRAGVPLLEGLVDLRDSVDQPQMREIAANLIEDIEGGQQLSQAMAAHPQVFDQVFVSLIRAGEASGELPTVLGKLAEAIKWQDELVSRMRRIVMYPAFVGVLVFAVVCFLLIYLVPQLVAFITAMKQTLPFSTQLLLWLSTLFANAWWAIIGLPVVLLLLGRWRYQQDEAFQMQADGYLLRLPVLGPIVKKIVLARFAGFFGLLYGAGLPILECLQICEGIMGNRVLSAAVAQAGQQIREGQGVSASFAQVGLFPALVLRMLRIGENTGQLDGALANVAYFYDRDIKEAIERVQALVEPTMTVILGLLLAGAASPIGCSSPPCSMANCWSG